MEKNYIRCDTFKKYTTSARGIPDFFNQKLCWPYLLSIFKGMKWIPVTAELDVLVRINNESHHLAFIDRCFSLLTWDLTTANDLRDYQKRRDFLLPNL